MKICLDELKKRIEAFRDEDFGEPLEAPAPAKMPTHIPPVGKHPRIGFTAYFASLSPNFRQLIVDRFLYGV